ncbi:MAG: GatB/YqeY domain-containing protein [Actinomycetota bacterium]|nr:GatB/YqeY domain-containing protein [Actinomycetota bacterium]
MSTFKERLRSDLTAAMKGRDELTRDTLRMTLAAVMTAEVSGVRARDLTDDEVLAVVRREVKKRHESAETYSAAGRQELADRELAEAGVLDGYLPRQLDDDAVRALVAAAISASGASGPRDMGAAMGLAKQRAGTEVDGKRLSSEVSRQLRELSAG